MRFALCASRFSLRLLVLHPPEDVLLSVHRLTADDLSRIPEKPRFSQIYTPLHLAICTSQAELQQVLASTGSESINLVFLLFSPKTPCFQPFFTMQERPKARFQIRVPAIRPSILAPLPYSVSREIFREPEPTTFFDAVGAPRPRRPPRRRSLPARPFPALAPWRRRYPASRR
jgi:hypothetical protein